MNRLGRVKTDVGGGARVPQRDPCRISQCVCVRQSQRATEQTASNACEAESRALLVGEHGDGESSCRVNLPFPKKIHCAQTTDHTKRAIKRTTIGNRVEMTSCEHGSAPIVFWAVPP